MRRGGRGRGRGGIGGAAAGAGAVVTRFVREAGAAVDEQSGPDLALLLRIPGNPNSFNFALPH